MHADPGDTPRITVAGDGSRKISVGDRFTGDDAGKEPPGTGSGADGTSCPYAASGVTDR